MKIPEFVEMGVDMSRYQKPKNIKYNEFWNNKQSFAMLRAGFGKYLAQKDEYFDTHYKNCFKYNVYCGAYHYSYATSIADAKKESDTFLKLIDGKILYYPVAYDIEDKTQRAVDKRLLTDIALTWLETVENAGYYVMIYSNFDFFKNHFIFEDLKKYDKWFAYYGRVDNMFDKYKMLSGQIFNGIWQRGTVKYTPIVSSGAIDLNYSYKNYAKIIKAKGLNNLWK